MCEIFKGAIRIAAEMVEAHINNHVPLDTDYIADKSCEISYKIHERSSQYEKPESLKIKDIEKLVRKAMSEYREDPKPIHHP